MPYIKQEDRPKIDEHLDKVSLEHEGELNYAITKLIVNYMKSRERRYSLLNTIIGVLESAKQEFYDRVVRPYEDEKIKENSDVY